MTSPSQTIQFGPASRPWTYTPSTKTYDLSPSTSSSSKLTIPTTSGVPDTHFTIDPSKTVLIIVDMQNFFLSEKCMAHPNGLAAVEPTIQLIKKCRDAGVQVIWLNWGLTDTDMATMPAGVNRGFLKDLLQNNQEGIRPYHGLGADLGDGKGRTLFAGSWNADIFAPLKEHVRPEDIHCKKIRMSGLHTIKTDLYGVLKEGGWENLLFTGVNTDQCVLGTLVDAYNKGWGCIAVEDCCGTTTPGGREVSLHNIANSYGFVTSSEAIIAAQ